MAEALIGSICGQCGDALIEDWSDDHRKPCPKCGSLTRRVVADIVAPIETGAGVESAVTTPIEADRTFDFQEHERAAVTEYLRNQTFYAELASVVARILNECLTRNQIKVHSVQHRAKDANSLGRKAAIPSEIDPNRPKYPDPLRQITDLAGVRIITQVLGTLDDVDELLHPAIYHTRTI